MSAEKCATQIPFYLDPTRCVPHRKSAVNCALCDVRTRKCASARVQVGVVSALPVTLTAVATG